MWKIVAAGLVASAMAASSMAFAQQPAAAPKMASTWTADDVNAFSDARIASLKAGLKLNADQEKNWPPVASAIRDMSMQRVEYVNRMRANAATLDPIAVLRLRADAMTASATSMKKLADASEPLYKSLDDAQKRRLLVLIGSGARR